jgi:hypothetical protein
MRLVTPSFSLLCLLLLAATLVVGCRKDESAIPGASPFPETQALSDREMRVMYFIRDRVSDLRGLALNPDVREALVSREALGKYFVDANRNLDEEGKRSQEARTRLYRLLRMIGPSESLRELSTIIRSGSVAGLYFDTEKQLLVVGTKLSASASQQSTIAHEYVHSMQDNAFKLATFREYGKDLRYMEYGLTTLCVAEGDASVAELAYLKDLYGDSWLVALGPPEDYEALQKEMAKVPSAVQREFFFNYRECVAFVEAILRESGWDGVNQLYQRPPASTEQVMHVGKYLANDLPLNVGTSNLAPGKGWELVNETVFGEFDVYNYLYSTNVGDEDARRAAAGWGGGNVGVYGRGGGDSQDALVHIMLAWDTDADYQEFRTVYAIALKRLDYEKRSLDGSVWDWQSRREYGVALWDDARRRVEILLSTDRGAFDRVEKSLREAGASE